VHVSKDAAGRALLVVEDRGPGIDPDERAELFTPFHSSRAKTAAGRGYGLGLSIVRQVARAHGGEVEYSAFEEGGSRFTVRLPL
jgi:two-component system OmpR family sensor kinase